jgi:hypothetical protein
LHTAQKTWLVGNEKKQEKKRSLWGGLAGVLRRRLLQRWTGRTAQALRVLTELAARPEHWAYHLRGVTQRRYYGAVSCCW